MRRIYSLFALILIFIAIGCGKSDDNTYTVLTTKENYLIATWRAETEKAAIIPARKLLESILMRPKASDAATVRERTLNPEKSPLLRKLPDMLPQNNEVRDWKIAEKIRTYAPDNLFDFHLDEAKLYKAYNVVSLATAEYLNIKLGSKPYLCAEVYDMGVPENAFGIYSINTYPQAQYDNVGNEAFMTELTYDTWKGRYFVHISAYEAAPDIKQGMIKIAKHIMSQIENTGILPDIINLLPKDNIVRGSVKFFKNHTAFNSIHTISEDRNVLRLTEKNTSSTSETNGIIAEYISEKAKTISDTVNILLIKYPTTSDAQAAYSSYKTYLLKNGIPKSEGKLGDKSIIIKTPTRLAQH